MTCVRNLARTCIECNDALSARWWRDRNRPACHPGATHPRRHPRRRAHPDPGARLRRDDGRRCRRPRRSLPAHCLQPLRLQGRPPRRGPGASGTRGCRGLRQRLRKPPGGPRYPARLRCRVRRVRARLAPVLPGDRAGQPRGGARRPRAAAHRRPVLGGGRRPPSGSRARRPAHPRRRRPGHGHPAQLPGPVVRPLPPLGGAP